MSERTSAASCGGRVPSSAIAIRANGSRSSRSRRRAVPFAIPAAAQAVLCAAKSFSYGTGRPHAASGSELREATRNAASGSSASPSARPAARTATTFRTSCAARRVESGCPARASCAARRIAYSAAAPASVSSASASAPRAAATSAATAGPASSALQRDGARTRRWSSVESSASPGTVATNAKRSASATSSGSAPAYPASSPSSEAGGFMAPQRCRSFGSGIPCSTRSWTSGKSLFCTSGRQRDTSSTRTDSASHTVAGVCRYSTRPSRGTGKPTRSSNDRSEAL